MTEEKSKKILKNRMRAMVEILGKISRKIFKIDKKKSHTQNEGCEILGKKKNL